MRFRRSFALGGVILLIGTVAFSQRQGRLARPGTGDVTAYAVPWRYLEPGVTPAGEPLVVDWFPASRQEIDRSQLLHSHVLTDYAGQCVGLQVILPEDEARLDKFGLHDARPAVLLVDHNDHVIRRVKPDHGTLRVSDVEKALEDELNARGSVIVRQLTDARTKATAGDRNAAVDLYKTVWEQRCLFPFAAHEAQRALADLGVKVEPPPPAKAAPSAGAPQTKTQ